MSSYGRRKRMNRDTAEQFLSGDPATLGAGHHPRVAELLSAARAAGRPSDLAGEPAAMAAFAAAQLSPSSPNRRPSMIKLALAKVLTLKAAVVAGVACAGVGGVALAANAGVLPAPIASHLPGVHSSSEPAHPRPSGSALPSALPSGSAAPGDLAALCREFIGRGDQAHRDKALQEQHFGELVRRAGKPDRDRVEKFCAKVKPSESPSAGFDGSLPPSGKPGDLPGNRPSEQPSAGPGAHAGYPTGQPSHLPSGSAAPTQGPKG